MKQYSKIFSRAELLNGCCRLLLDDKQTQEGMMEGLGVFMIIVYLGIAIFMISLAIRFVNAVEKMSDSIGKIAEKTGVK